MEAMLSEFNYFAPPMVQASILEEYDEAVAPASDVKRDQPINLVLKGAPGLYRDLNNSYIVVKCKVIKVAGGANLDADTAVAPVNLLLHSLFESVDVSVNGTKVNDSDTLYAYRAYIESILGYSQDVLETRAVSEGFSKDDAAKMDVVTLAVDGSANTGFVARQKWVNLSKVMTLVGRPHSDLFHQELDIPAEVSLALKLTMNKDKFALMAAAGATFAIEVLDVRWFVRTKKVAPSLSTAHLRMLGSRCNYQLPFTKVSLKTHTLGDGQSKFELSNLLTGNRLPTRVVVAMTTSAAIAGAYNLNPFRFQNFKLTSMVWKVNERLIPFEPQETDFPSGDYNRAYLSTLAALGFDTGNHALAIKPSDWADGYNIYAFKFAPGPTSSGVLSPPVTGRASLKLTFADALTAPVDLIIFTEPPSTLEIDQFGKVTTSN